MSNANELLTIMKKQGTETASVRPTDGYKEIRNTGGAPFVNKTIETTISPEIRSDRQISDLLVVGATTDGSLNIVFGTHTYDELLEGALFNDFEETSAIDFGGATAGSNTITLRTATGLRAGAIIYYRYGGNTYTHKSPSNLSTAIPAPGVTPTTVIEEIGLAGQEFSAGSASIRGSVLTVTGGSLAVLKLKKGQFLKIKGFDKELTAEIKSVSATEITFYESLGTLTTASKVTILLSKRLVQGVKKNYFAIQQQPLDHERPTTSSAWNLLVNEFKLDLASGSLSTGSFAFIGTVDAEYSESASQRISDYAKTGKNSIINSASDVSQFILNGQDGGSAKDGIFSVSLTVANGVAGRNVVSKVGATSLRSGSANITFDLGAYFDSIENVQKAFNNEVNSLKYLLSSGGTGYLVSFPAFKYNGSKPDTEGVNGEINFSPSCTCIGKNERGYQMGIFKFPFDY